MSLSPLHCFCVLLLASVAFSQSGDPAPMAPDGHPGFGTLRTSRELGRVFQKPSEQDEELLTGLADLDSEVRILVEMARRTYKRRGYFELLDRFGPQELADLHGSYFAAEAEALDLIANSSPVADAWIDMFLDLRFRSRLPLLEVYAAEAREVQAGLALLRALEDGYVELKDREARAIAERIDLAASLLRAIRLDLEALRERGDDAAPGQPDPAWKIELIGISKMRPGEHRDQAFEELSIKVAARQKQLESVLFWPRLRTKLDLKLRSRELGREKALEHLAEVKFYLLEFEEGDVPPPDLLKMKKFARHQYALSEALKGIGYDPFNEALAYRAGIATDLIYETQESRQWFDRFLTLRGIRLHLYQTTERELDDEEEQALLVLMRPMVQVGR